MPQSESSLPLWKTIVHDIQDAIASGELAAGMLLPTEIYLAQQYGGLPHDSPSRYDGVTRLWDW
jgi:DNA-binding GntR family transcriptional regulator